MEHSRTHFICKVRTFPGRSDREGPHRDGIPSVCSRSAVFFPPNRLTKVSVFSVSLPDVDECSLQTHTCWNHSVCVNLPGGYDCVCASGPGCSGDCQQDTAVRRNGEDWKPSYDRCALCSCKVAHVWTHTPPRSGTASTPRWFLWQLWVNPRWLQSFVVCERVLLVLLERPGELMWRLRIRAGGGR